MVRLRCLLTLLILVGISYGTPDNSDKELVGYRNIEGVELVDGVPWTLDPSSRLNTLEDVYCMMGYYAGFGYANVRYGWADGVGVGTDANGNTGWVVWRFVAPDGKVTGTGGTASGRFLRIGPWSENLYFASKETLVVDEEYWTHPTDYDELNPDIYPCYDRDRIPTDPNDDYWVERDLSVDIPAGVSEFYIILADVRNCSTRFGIMGSVPFIVDVPLVDACTPPVTADLDGDCAITVTDLAIMAGQWLECADYNDPARCLPDLVSE